MPTTIKAQEVIADLEQVASKAKSTSELLNAIVLKLNEVMLKYNWVGFYMIEETPGASSVLVLGPFFGAMTPHTRIPLNQGICGAAASTGKTVVVDDVNSDSRYLACSLETKSEIVVPVFANGKVVGELDIDSHFPAAFGPEDKEICEHAARLAGEFIERHPS
jgi:L-methionine (R)-S-oxide reductase